MFHHFDILLKRPSYLQLGRFVDNVNIMNNLISFFITLLS